MVSEMKNSISRQTITMERLLAEREVCRKLRKAYSLYTTRFETVSIPLTCRMKEPFFMQQDEVFALQ